MTTGCRLYVYTLICDLMTMRKTSTQFEITTALLRTPADELGITATEKTVLVTMSTFLPNIACSHSRVALLSGLSTKTVQRSIANLVKADLLKITSLFDNRLNKACSYILGSKLQLTSDDKNIDLSWSIIQTPTHSFYKYRCYWTSEQAAEEAKRRTS